MKITREDVIRVADLAYLELSESELETYRAQIDEILEYIGKLNELDTANVAPMAQVLTDDQTADATLREDIHIRSTVATGSSSHSRFDATTSPKLGAGVTPYRSSMRMIRTLAVMRPDQTRAGTRIQSRPRMNA